MNDWALSMKVALLVGTSRRRAEAQGVWLPLLQTLVAWRRWAGAGSHHGALPDPRCSTAARDEARGTARAALIRA